MNDIEHSSCMILLRRILIYLLFAFLTFALNAYNLRQLSSKDGLSNSAILSICQDSERFMWVGSVDGLNVYDGVDINIFKPNMNTPGGLSSNLIEEVLEGEEGVLWINTNHGLNRYNKKTREIKLYNEFDGKYYLAKTSTHDVFAIHEDNKIDYYDKHSEQFIPVYYPDIIKKDIQRIFIDETNVLWIVTNKGIIQNALISLNSDVPIITSLNNFVHNCGVRYAFMEDDQIYFIDDDYFFFEMDAVSQKKSLVISLKNEVEGQGIVSAIVKDSSFGFRIKPLERILVVPQVFCRFL